MRDLLIQKWSFLEFMAIRGSYAKQERTPNTLIMYYVFMILAFLVLQVTVI